MEKPSYEEMFRELTYLRSLHAHNQSPNANVVAAAVVDAGADAAPVQQQQQLSEEQRARVNAALQFDEKVLADNALVCRC